MLSRIEIHFNGEKLRLEIDSATNLIMHLIYTDTRSSKAEVFLMKATYDEVNGLMLPTRRAHYRSDWEGNIEGSPILEETLDQIQFWNGFTNEDF
jgi:hypothetical protein